MSTLPESPGGSRDLHPPANDPVKIEIIGVYRGLLERLWARLVSLIGETATAAVFRSSLRETMHDHPFLAGIDVSESGVCMDRLEGHFNTLDRTALRTSLVAFMDSLLGLLCDLTGEILLRKVQPLVQELRQQMEE